MSMVRAPRHPATTDRHAGAGIWLLAALVVLLFAPLALPTWIGGLALLRFGKVKRRWLLAVAGGIVLVHLARRGFRVDTILAEHFTFWREVMPRFMEEAGKANPRPFESLGLGFFFSGLAGSLWLSIPLGLVFACGSMYGRKVTHPEWSEQARKEKESVAGSALAKASQQAMAPPDAQIQPPALGPMLGGDLAWGVKHKGTMWLQLPEATLNLPRVLVGEPGFGKTYAFLRIVYTYAALGYQVIFVDGKGTDPSLPSRVISAFLAGGGGSRVMVYPDEPATMWRGTPRDVVQKVLSVWTFAEQHQFFEAVAENGLALAIDVPGAPPVTDSAELLRRLDPINLTRLHKSFGTQESRATLGQITKLKEWGLDGFALRLRSLLRAIGPTLDGDRGFEDVDLAVLTVPSGLKRKDASATIRVLLEEFGMYASGRKGDRPCLLVFDEFSALQGGRATAEDLVERLRSTSTEVMLGVQSFEGLGGSGPGSMWTAQRLLNSCSGGLLLFRTPSPDNFVRLAGSVQMPDISHNLDHFGLTDRGLVRTAGKFRVDPDLVRQLVPGQMYYITGGRAALCFVATTEIPAWVHNEAELHIEDAQARGRRAERLRQAQEGEDAEAS